MATTLYRIAEECLKALSGGNIAGASNISLGEMKISICQVANQLLKVEHFSVNEKMAEKIDNGAVIGWYEDISVTSFNGKSTATLPIKPIKLPRNMGVFGIYPKYESNGNYELDKEFIPLQMGQSALLKSQPMINDLLGQVGYENYGISIVFTKDIKTMFPNIVLAMRLAVLDFSQYDDYSILPLLPEQEWQIKQEVIKLYSGVGVADLLVDSSNKQQQNIPVPQQKQT
jgi:hypothetical protein